MAFNPIDSTDIEEGKPVRSSTQSKIKQNFDDHEYRLTQLQASEVVPPIVFRVNGPYSLYGGTQSTVLRTAITKKLVVTGCRLISDAAGSSGILSIDIRRVRSGVSNSIFDAAPSLASTAGDDATSPNAVLSEFRYIDEGDFLELDITSVQTGGIGFLVRLDVYRDES